MGYYNRKSLGSSVLHPLCIIIVVIMVCNFKLSFSATLSGLPRSGALLVDGVGGRCAGVFIDSGFVLTTTTCANVLVFGSGVTVSSVYDTDLTYAAAGANPYTTVGGANGVALIQLICPGVMPSTIASGDIRFAELATPAFDANSCLPQGTITGPMTLFVGIGNTMFIGKRDSDDTVQLIIANYLYGCDAEGSFEDESSSDGSGSASVVTTMNNGNTFNCFNTSSDPILGSPLYIQDQNRLREIVIGLAESTGKQQGDEDIVPYVRISQYIAELARFLVDQSTGRGEASTNNARYARQQQIRMAIQAGLRPASLFGYTGSVPAYNAPNPNAAKRATRNQQESFFLDTFAHGNWHQHSDGKSSILSTSHLQARVQSKFKRAPSSSFDCPDVNPGCSTS